MRIKFSKLFILAIYGSFLNLNLLYAADGPLKIVATQTLYADIVRQIGEEKVEVKSVASPKFNVHFIQPKPSDVRNVAHADLVVYTGLDLEEWWGPLVEAAGRPEFFPGREKSVDLSRGIRLLKVPDHPLSRAEGDIHLFGNPHYIMNPENAVIMAGTILEKLKSVDPANASFYEENEKAFSAKLESKIAGWRALCAHCAGKEIVAYHDEVEYLVDFLGMKDSQFLEPKPGIPPTPKHLEFLEKYMKENNVRVITTPTYFPKSSADVLAAKTGAKAVTLAMNVGELPGTEDIFAFFDYDVKTLSEALK